VNLASLKVFQFRQGSSQARAHVATKGCLPREHVLFTFDVSGFEMSRFGDYHPHAGHAERIRSAPGPTTTAPEQACRAAIHGALIGWDREPLALEPVDSVRSADRVNKPAP